MIWLIVGIIAAVVLWGISFVLNNTNKEDYNNASLQLRVFSWFSRAASVTALVSGILFSSVYFVSSKHIGIIDKKWGGNTLTGGRIVATNGENGIQAAVLRDGLHWGKFRWQLSLIQVPLVRINNNEIGIISTRDGRPMPSDRVFAPEWDSAEVSKMLDAEYFLSGKDGARGYKGSQLTVIGPGEYPIHPGLYDIDKVPITVVNQGQVGVIKANVSGIPSTLAEVYAQLAVPEVTPQGTVAPGKIGVWSVPLPPGKYWIHPNAYQVTIVDVTRQQMDFMGDATADAGAEAVAVHAKAKDGIAFYVDNTITFHIEPADAPVVVAQIGIEKILGIVDTQVRQTMRDKIGESNTLAFINDRVREQVLMTTAIQESLKPYYVTVDDDSIRDIRGEQLTALLKTQSDREIAKQQEQTYVQQQQAALKQQELNKAEQAAIEERSLATAAYAAKQEVERKTQAITKAEAEAEQVRIAAQADADKITIQAKANADAIALKGNAEAERYRLIVQALGPENATSIELIERVRDEIGKIKLPELFIIGGNSGASSAIEARLLQLMSDDRKTADTLSISK